jgi:hypothetical protein
MPIPTSRDDDDLGELPPLDGDGDDQPDSAEPENPEEGPGDASLDDATGEDDPIDPGDLGLNEAEPGWLDEPTDAPDLDLGAVGLVDFADERDPLDDVEEPGVAGEDFGLGSADSAEDELDTGDEGPLDEDDALREEDLPRLDADEEGDLEDAALVEAGFAADEPVGLAWAADPWPRVGAPVGLLSATSIACVARGALSAGRSEEGTAELLHVDLEGTSQTLAASGLDVAGVRALAAERNRVVALVDSGQVAVSRDRGASFDAIGGVVAAEIALVGDVVWMRTRAGGILGFPDASARVTASVQDSSASGGFPSSNPSLRSGVRAIARDVSGRVAGLLTDDAGRVLALVSVSDDGSPREPIEAPEARMPASLAVRVRHAAYSARGGGVVRRLAGGAWRMHAWEGPVAALAFVDDAGTLVAATYSDADDTTALVRLDPQGVASVVARIGPASHGESDGRVLALAYDDPRGVVWVAGGFGVAAFSVR